MSEKTKEKSEMSDVAECQSLIRDLFPPALGSVGERIRTAARRLEWRFTRTNDIWYAQARRIDGFEKEQLKALKAEREAREAKEKADRERSTSREEYRNLRNRIARLEAALAISDAEHSQPFRDGLQHAMGGFRGMGDAGTGRGRPEGEGE